MHRIRAYSRREAWYDDDGESSHNPFKRFRVNKRSPGGVHPLEHGLQRARPLVDPLLFQRDNITKIEEDVTSADSAKVDKKNRLRNQIFYIVLSSWAHILIFIVPVGFVLYYIHAQPIVVFVVNLTAIIPSSSMLGLATDELTIYFDKKAIIVGLISSTFGNAVQLIQSILLLKSRQLTVLRVSLLGSILSNLLLLTGSSFLVGGLRYYDDEQHFNKDMTQTITMLLFLAVLSLVIPTASHYVSGTDSQAIVPQSKGIAIVVMISYILWLIFQLETHRDMFNDHPQSPRAGTRRKGDSRKALIAMGELVTRMGSSFTESHPPDDEVDHELTPLVAIVTITITTVLIAFNTQFATDTIQSLIDRSVSTNFIGLVILPVLSLDTGAIKCAFQDRMDLAISLTLGKCLQLALFVIPLTVLVAGWIHVDDMSLKFDGFTVVCLFIAMVILGYVVQEGKSNWLTGALLIKIYVIVAISSWWIP